MMSAWGTTPIIDFMLAADTDFPFTCTVPEAGIFPSKAFMNVDLPAPLGPMTASISPACTLPDTSCKSFLLPNLTSKSWKLNDTGRGRVDNLGSTTLCSSSPPSASCCFSSRPAASSCRFSVRLGFFDLHLHPSVTLTTSQRTKNSMATRNKRNGMGYVCTSPQALPASQGVSLVCIKPHHEPAVH